MIIRLNEHPTINEIIITGEKATKFKDASKKILNQKNGPFIKSFIAEDEKIKNYIQVLDLTF